MSAAEHSVERREKPRVSIFPVVLSAIAMIALVAFVLDDGGARVEVVVPQRNLPAFHLIGESDLTTKSFARRDLIDGYVENADDLEGRIARVALEAGESVGADSVTQAVDGEIGEVRFELRSESAQGLNLGPGDRVVLRLAPTRRGGDPASVPALLLRLPAEDAEEQTYVVAVAGDDVGTLLSGLGRSRLFVTPLPERQPESVQAASSPPG